MWWQRILEARRRHPSWGAKQLGSIVCQRHPRWPWPARSTVCDMLSRHGFVPTPRQRRVIGPPGQPTSSMAAPNDVWRADFTGPFKTGDGHDGSPLTLTAGDRRVLLSCQALSATSVAAATPVCMRVFKACGLPRRLRTDQRRAVRHPHPGTALPVVRVVGTPGPLAGVHRTRYTATERSSRAQASHAESRHHPTAWRHPSCTAAEVQPRPRRVHPCASAGGARQAHPRGLR